MQMETIILRSLLNNPDFMRSVIPHIKSEYFTSEANKKIFQHIQQYVEKYNTIPNVEALEISIYGENNVKQGIIDQVKKELETISNDINKVQKFEWLYDKAQEWCKTRSIFIAVYDCVDILDGGSKTKTVGSMPEILKEALAVSFDTSVGHDWLEDSEARFDFYNTDVERLKFGVEDLNDITGGGVPKKTLNILMGGTGGFKSGTMCSFAADYMAMGKNVLYITMELAEERVAERIDANLLDTSLDDLKRISKPAYLSKVDFVRQRTQGRLKIKEYPTAGAHVGHFRNLLRELELKDDFKPDVIFIDYVNICASARTTMAAGSYGYVKAIAEEMRGLAVEYNVPIWTATQTNRSGATIGAEVDLSHVSESAGLSHTADLMLVLVSTEELQDQGLLLIKQLKNRYGDLNHKNKFTVGKDGGKMKVFDTNNPNKTYFAAKAYIPPNVSALENTLRSEERGNQASNAIDTSKVNFDSLEPEARAIPADMFGSMNTLDDKRKAISNFAFDM